MPHAPGLPTKTVGVRVVWLFLLILLVGFASASAVIGQAKRQRPSNKTETWRKQPPKPAAPRSLTLPAVRETRLDNGLTLLLIEDHRSPIVTIIVGIPVNTEPLSDIAELTNQIALFEATAELITEGAGARSSEQVAREVETLGGRLSSAANDDYADVSVSVVSENAERMIDLVGDVLLHPTFPETEVALHKRNRIQTLSVQRQDPSYLAREQFDRIVYGAHPYAISSPTPESIDALDRNKISAFYRSHFGPRGSVAIIVGDFDAGRIESKARGILSEWKEPQSKPAGTRAEAQSVKTTERQVYLIDRPGSEQADFRIGAPGVRRADPDYFPLLVANSILGAGTGSRLFLNIREQKGYAYDVYSSLSALRLGGTFFAGAETRAEVTVRAIKDILAEFDRLREVKVGPRELQGAKNYINGLFSLSLSAQGGVAERILQSRLLGLGVDYLETYRSRIESVTPEQVQAVVRKYILSDRPVIVVVGDASKLAKDLRTIGPVQIFDIEGKPLKQALPSN